MTLVFKSTTQHYAQFMQVESTMFLILPKPNLDMVIKFYNLATEINCTCTSR